ncbi:hypothetical protein HanXRQr2_Chr16g0730641 [Helianthus annuus]|uniref:Uncharacterized protein n=1 Tax=Helianthus annuus TaxID=4232 RepID=A0A9K3GXH2_HELAN|nr:hypothetical protein HanXRQr2_Chr16g0730641 [Helianthus annuus]
MVVFLLTTTLEPPFCVPMQTLNRQQYPIFCLTVPSVVSLQIRRFVPYVSCKNFILGFRLVVVH